MENHHILAITTAFFAFAYFRQLKINITPKKPTYNELCRRLKELRAICVCYHDNKIWHQELISVSDKLKKIDRNVNKINKNRNHRNCLKGGYEEGFEGFSNSLNSIVAFKASSNNLVRPESCERPDLSFIVTGKTKSFEEFQKWYNRLTPEQAKIFNRIDIWIPELIHIAELYIDEIQPKSDKRVQYAYALTILNRIYYGNPDK